MRISNAQRQILSNLTHGRPVGYGGRGQPRPGHNPQEASLRALERMGLIRRCVVIGRNGQRLEWTITLAGAEAGQ